MEVADFRHHYHDSIRNYMPWSVQLLCTLTGKRWRRFQRQPQPISVLYRHKQTTSGRPQD